jgi:hypothetical protein
MRWPSRLLTTIVLPLLGCTGLAEGSVSLAPGSWPGQGGLPVTRHAVVVERTSEVALQHAPPSAPPTGLGVLEGKVVVGTPDGLHLGAAGALAEEPLTLERISAIDAQGGVLTVTGVRAIATRPSGELLVAAAEGLLHSAGTTFFHSPSSGLIAADTVLALESSGDSRSERIWLTTATHVDVIENGQHLALQLEGLPPPTFAAALGEGAGLLGVEEDLYVVELSPARAARRLRDVGPIHGAVHRDGALLLAAEGGLIEAWADGRMTLTSFATPEGTPLPVRALGLGPGGLHLLAGESLLRESGEGFRHLTEIPGGGASGDLAIDPAGHTWVGTSTGLVRARSGTAVRHAELEDFFVEHCVRCHDGGAEGAPDLDFLDHAVAKAWASRIVARLADEQSPMPPRRVGVLYPEDWALVQRWVEGGSIP